MEGKILQNPKARISLNIGTPVQFQLLTQKILLYTYGPKFRSFTKFDAL